ncbi:hypothetical protein T12_11943 [Trichinella patagoniensis]|uniref:Uncharacterized protein n=1 Tax=Trichinella patagoniensis TaxID=990121 RepID=A0A0V0Z4D8_9BILA|nr:hypothetical protein T12_11943 [Trichinella patagoniensis]
MEVQGGERGEDVFSVRVRFVQESDRHAGRIKRVIVQDSEAAERKGICGDYWKIVSVNQVDLFVGLTRECEACQKTIGRLVVRKQAQKAKITNDIKIYLA